MFLLIVGMVQFGKITYMYYSLQKTMTRRGQLSGGAEGVNFCLGASDPAITAAINSRITGTTDGSGTPTITDLTADMLTVTTQCIDPVTLTLGDCSVSGCDTPVGAQRPDFIMVSMPNGYIVQPRIPYILLDPIPLQAAGRDGRIGGGIMSDDGAAFRPGHHRIRAAV